MTQLRAVFSLEFLKRCKAVLHCIHGILGVIDRRQVFAQSGCYVLYLDLSAFKPCGELGKIIIHFRCLGHRGYCIINACPYFLQPVCSCIDVLEDGFELSENLDAVLQVLIFSGLYIGILYFLQCKPEVVLLPSSLFELS